DRRRHLPRADPGRRRRPALPAARGRGPRRAAAGGDHPPGAPAGRAAHHLPRPPGPGFPGGTGLRLLGQDRGPVSVRLGVIADIHGNDVALRAVLKDAGCFAVERWWALGDLVLDGLPSQLRLRLPGGTAVLGVHASPRADDGQGIEPGIAAEELGPLLAGADAEVVIGGHTHAADRVVGGVRALNPGSTGLPRR